MPSAYPSVSSARSAATRGRTASAILEAARGAFAELGIDASVEEIASRAGVGMGTLYRRFPTKDALIDAVFEDHLDRIAAAAEQALEATMPGRGCSTTSPTSSSLQAADRGLSEIVGANLRTEQLLGRARTRLRPLVQRLIIRAQEAGELRADVVYEDISVLLWTTGRVVDATRDIAPEFWQRYLALTVDGLRAQAASPLPQPPLTPARHREAMRRFTQPRSRPPRD